MAKPQRAMGPSERVVIGVISGSLVHAHWSRCLFDLAMFDAYRGAKRLGHGHPSAWNIGTTLIFKSRNELVRHFLAQSAADWLLMTDPDQTFEPTLLEQLMASADKVERPVIGVPTPCLKNDDPVARVAVVGHNAFAAGPAPEGQSVPYLFTPYDDLPLGENTLVQVAAIGTGIMLVHRSVFEKIRTFVTDAGMGDHWCWFQTPVYPPNLAEGEDIFFARMCINVGAPQFAHCGVKTGHIKPIVLDSWTMPYERFSI